MGLILGLTFFKKNKKSLDLVEKSKKNYKNHESLDTQTNFYEIIFTFAGKKMKMEGNTQFMKLEVGS